MGREVVLEKDSYSESIIFNLFFNILLKERERDIRTFQLKLIVKCGISEVASLQRFVRNIIQQMKVIWGLNLGPRTPQCEEPPC